MPGRTSDVSVSTFKPLSLDEILMVPLFKQKKHEAAQKALDELDVLEANSLDIDKDYVTKQQASIRGQAGNISDELLSQGVNSGLINKLRSLRRTKNREFSLEGGVGKAMQAYDAMNTNKKIINARKDLTAEQKVAGIQQSVNQYTGVAEGGSYEDYVGASYVDFMKRGVELAKQMTPEEVMKRLNMKKVNNGYSDGEYIHKELKPEHIKAAIRQQLESEPGVMNYLKEMESLGLGNAEQMLNQAAEGAANIGKVDIKKQYRYFNTNDEVIDDENGLPDLGQTWHSRYLNSGMSVFNETFDLDGGYGEKPYAFTNAAGEYTGYIEDVPNFTGEKTEFVYPNTANPYSTYQSPGKKQEVQTIEYREYLNRYGEGFKVKKQIDKLRDDNPMAFYGKDDKFVYDAYQLAKINATKKMSELFKPINEENPFYSYAGLTKGNSEMDGDYSTRGMKVLGETNFGEKNTYKEVADRLGYGDDLVAFNEAMKQSSIMGTVPSDIDYPFATAFSIASKDGQTRKTILVESDDSVKDYNKHAGNMTRNLIAGIPVEYAGMDYYLMDENDPNSRAPYHMYYVNRLNPVLNQYESVLVKTVHQFPDENVLKYLQLQTDKRGRLTGSAYLGKEGTLYNDVTVQTHAQVLDKDVKRVLQEYDYQSVSKTAKERVPQYEN
jgi:hypothetical protein